MQAANRREIHHRPALGLSQYREDRPDGAQDAEHVDVELLLDERVFCLLDGAHVAVPGVVDEDVDLPEVGEGVGCVCIELGLGEGEVELEDFDVGDL